jgi:hypothetical protein
VRAHLPQRHDDVPRLERPRSRLGQHRRVEHEVLGRRDRRAALAEQACDSSRRRTRRRHERPAQSFGHVEVLRDLGEAAREEAALGLGLCELERAPYAAAASSIARAGAAGRLAQAW